MPIEIFNANSIVNSLEWNTEEIDLLEVLSYEMQGKEGKTHNQCCRDYGDV
jgi:hypothetical protein